MVGVTLKETLLDFFFPSGFRKLQTYLGVLVIGHGGTVVLELC